MPMTGRKASREWLGQLYTRLQKCSFFCGFLFSCLFLLFIMMKLQRLSLVWEKHADKNLLRRAGDKSVKREPVCLSQQPAKFVAQKTKEGLRAKAYRIIQNIFVQNIKWACLSETCAGKRHLVKDGHFWILAMFLSFSPKWFWWNWCRFTNKLVKALGQ